MADETTKQDAEEPHPWLVARPEKVADLIWQRKVSGDWFTQNRTAKRVDALIKGVANNPSDAERAAVAFAKAPTHLGAVELLAEIGRQGGVRTHRPAVLQACMRTLRSCKDGEEGALYDAAVRVREQNRALGRTLAKRAVGSTLLLKGLESDVSVILNADALDAANLYVAMTRGSKQLVVCSSKPVLNPA